MPWYTEPFVLRMLEAEQQRLDVLLPKFFGYHLVCMTEPALSHLAASSLIQHRILIDPQQVDSGSSNLLRCRFNNIALQAETVDVVLLVHLLERIEDPHVVIREVERILRPEGVLVMTAFNPVGPWALWQRLRHPFRSKKEQHIPAARIRDWLKLLNFQIVDGHYCCFQWPFIQKHLPKMERWGEKWWPFWGSVYTIVAIKRPLQLTPIRPKWPRLAVWQEEDIPIQPYRSEEREL